MFVLNCLISRERVERVFSVKILEDLTISCLKEIIKAKKEHAFASLNADDLVLRHVDISLDDSKDLVPWSPNDSLMAPYLKISKYFPIISKHLRTSTTILPTAPFIEEHLHVFIER